MKMKNIYQKLEGRELEFAAYVAEAVSGQEPTTWLSLIEDDVRFNEMSLEEVKGFIKQLNDLIGDVYTILHAWNRYHPCFKVHESWREGSIDIYRKLCDNNTISDKFDLLKGK